MNIKKYLHSIINKTLKSFNILNKYKHKIYTNNKISDYQISSIIQISKKENIKINKIILKIKNQIKKKKIFKKIKIVKPGFINLFLNKKYILQKINKYSKLKNFGIKKHKKKNIIIDFSSPNIAKEMHIGNLRSTILGDCMSKLLKLFGNNVIKINHIGDWGTPFGIIISWIKLYNLKNKINNIKILEKIYKKAYQKFKNDKKFANLARNNVVNLQNKNPKIIKIWKKIVNLTIKENQKIYNSLNINLKLKHNIGESYYNNMLPNIVKDLIKKKIATKNNNCIIIFIKKKKNFPIIIKKNNGSFLYSTTDLAAIKYRYEILKADKILYFIDIRQKEYLNIIFKISKKAKYIPNDFYIKHFYFGTILNEKKKPIKTRLNNNLTIKKIIKIIKKKTKKIINKNNIYNKNNLNWITNKITIGTIKYIDLSKNRKTNYIFDINKTISFNFNTGLYLQYTYTRIISILRKNNTNATKSINNNKLFIYNSIEYLIIKKIINFEEILYKATKKCTPNIICTYLYELSTIFSKYYEKNNITNLKNLIIKKSKLKLISIVSKILRIGLYILGIPILYKI